MPPAPYPDFRWFFRTLRVLPVVAVAALAGGIIGGFSVFAIDLALTAPPNHGIPPEPGSKLASESANDNAAASPAPIRTFDAVTPRAAAAVAAAPATGPAPAVSNSNLPPVSEPAPLSASDISPAQPTAAAMTSTRSGAISGAITVVRPQTTVSDEQPGPAPVASPERTSWPDALSREHKAVPAETVTVPPAASEPQQAAVQTAQKPEVKAQTVKRRVAIKRPRTPNEPPNQMTSRNARPIYDDYGRQEDSQENNQENNQENSQDSRQESRQNSRAERRTAKPQYAVRRPPPADTERSSERADDRLYDRADDRGDDDGSDALPAQPPPLPFFGLFGGGDN